MIKTKTLGALCALMLILAQLGCEHGERGEHGEHGGEHGEHNKRAEGGHHGHGKAELLVSRPLQRDTEIVQDYVAQIHAVQHIELRAMERGYLQDIFVDEGQHVKKGQRMFQIMPLIYRAELQRVEAEAHFATIEYRNTASLHAKNVVSANELALVKAKLDKARAEVALAKAHLGLTEIRAPFDGIMNRLHVQRGSLLEEGELLTTLSDNSQMWVYFNVAEAEYLDYKAQNKDTSPPVKLMMANHKPFAHPGKVSTIGAEFNHETGNIAFRATFPNPEALLRHGETGKVLMSRVIKDAVVIPQKATFEILDKKYVYTLDAKNAVHSHQIEIAEELPHLYVVASGLTPTDRILIEGLRKVREGEVITPREEDPQKVLDGLDVPAE